MDVVKVFKGEDGQYHWHRKAPNNEIISQGEGYSRFSHAIEGAERANQDTNWVFKYSEDISKDDIERK